MNNIIQVTTIPLIKATERMGMGEIYPMPYLVLGPLALAALSIED